MGMLDYGCAHISLYMLKNISLIFIFIVASLGGKIWLERVSKPCTEPIAYYIGAYDQRFGLSRGELLSSLSQAESLWESSSGKDLFVYSATEGKLPVNLVYDYRQAVTEELSVIEDTVKTGEGSYDSMESRHLALRFGYNTLKKSYESQSAIFRDNSAEYEQSVERWNQGNRSSKKEFEVLEKERLALEAEFNALKSLESELNVKVRELNATVEALNALAKKLNLNVKEYNAVGASRGETFAGGTYTLDEKGERIDIYEFESKEKLVRILAHELGHALGLEHVDDPQAIMYYLNEGENEKLTEADLNALNLLCGVE